jgi:probable HAF family extracellular repeat protein
VYVYGSAINNFGAIVGWTDYDGFLCRHGICRILDFPGANKTEALGINDSGVIVGWYTVPQGCVCAFALKNGKYISFSYPGAAGTFAAGINASGQIVGEYTFDYNAYHGFVTSPITGADFQR